ncbi:hypothetical protein SCLCIDRAFT_434057 [Scleroderma citrinum Foug A]|uniref:Secreted protein n=1 Tax=Scleroderma citrinum Foug A TaxID=1036808 RepID=A0A0C2YV42_9AGAM|nr:hypothetical protein SCLCIDRAFT_434057 [Scleroderma citrinum Foug A]
MTGFRLCPFASLWFMFHFTLDRQMLLFFYTDANPSLRSVLESVWIRSHNTLIFLCKYLLIHRFGLPPDLPNMSFCTVVKFFTLLKAIVHSIRSTFQSLTLGGIDILAQLRIYSSPNDIVLPNHTVAFVITQAFFQPTRPFF